MPPVFGPSVESSRDLSGKYGECYTSLVRKLSDVLAERQKQDQDDRDLRSRSDARRERKRIEAESAGLAEALVDLPGRQLEKLELPPELLDAVLEARRIVSPVARKRALRLVRRELRAGDGASIEARLARVREPNRIAQPATVAAWCERLVTGTDAELEAWVEAGVDRQQLRTLVRNVRKASGAARGRALRVLARRLRQVAG